MNVIIASRDRYLSQTLGQLVAAAGLRNIRTNSLARIQKELKQPERVAIIDMTWEEVQEVGILKQLVNISGITGNRVVCICPNRDDDLKKLAKGARAHEVFLRYDIEGAFKEFLQTL